MSNTAKRLISAFVLMTIIVICIANGKTPVLWSILILGIICVDEVFCNFFRKQRASFEYLISQAIFLVPFIYFSFIEFAPGLVSGFVNGGVLLNALLVIYLFYTNIEDKSLVNICKKYPYISGLFFLLPLISLTTILHYSKWIDVVMTLLFINFGMDTGAWFFGKKFGKRKLWPKVSPKKTVEGLIGGILTAGVLGALYWQFQFGNMSFLIFSLFCFLGLLSQIGDLIQSKLKRQYEIKDSSNLIPGHGGFYDRIDSLLFLTPFYATSLRYIYFL